MTTIKMGLIIELGIIVLNISINIMWTSYTLTEGCRVMKHDMIVVKRVVASDTTWGFNQRLIRCINQARKINSDYICSRSITNQYRCCNTMI